MKRRIAKNSEYICRRQKTTDKSSFMRELYWLTYYRVLQKKAYVIRKRKENNVYYVGRSKHDAKKVLNSLNNKSKGKALVTF